MRGLLACSMALFVILAGAARGQGAEDLGPFLERVGHTVEVFWKDFSSMTCTEQILQEKFGKSGKIAYRHERLPHAALGVSSLLPGRL
jgi:hypothetical protein